MRTLLLATAAMLISAPAFAADHYEIDKAHTRILFYINHLGFSEMIGDMTQYDGKLAFDPQKPEDSSVDITLSPKGIRTSSAKLDEELQNDKFFNTDKFPAIHFVSTGIKATGAQDGDVTGNLTLLGVTKPVVLHVHLNKADYQPITNNFVAGFHASATFKRSDFSMTNYIPMVGDDVRIEIQTEGVDQDRKKSESIKKQ